MKVLLKKNVSKLGTIGDVVEVKTGYARNFLFPQGLAIEPTSGNLKAIEAERQKYLEMLARKREEMAAKARVIQGREITLSARANEEGHLYGSIGPAQIVAALADGGVYVEAEQVQMEEHIRKLDKYDVTLGFGEDVTATIHVWVVPFHEPGEESAQPAGESEAAPADDDDQ